MLVSSRLVSSRLVSDMSGAGVAEPLSNGTSGKELAIYSGPQWYYKWLQSADNSTDGDTRHDLPWICEVDNAAAALCLDYLRRHGKGNWVRDELYSGTTCSAIRIALGCGPCSLESLHHSGILHFALVTLDFFALIF